MLSFLTMNLFRAATVIIHFYSTKNFRELDSTNSFLRCSYSSLKSYFNHEPFFNEDSQDFFYFYTPVQMRIYFGYLFFVVCLFVCVCSNIHV